MAKGYSVLACRSERYPNVSAVNTTIGGRESLLFGIKRAQDKHHVVETVQQAAEREDGSLTCLYLEESIHCAISWTEKALSDNSSLISGNERTVYASRDETEMNCPEM